jgi:hypothetical protein
MWGLNALWSPILHYHSDDDDDDGRGGSNGGSSGGGGGGGGGISNVGCRGGGGRGRSGGDGARGGKLCLFYTESRKARSPGGDVKCIASLDAGESWSHPRTIFTHEADGGVPKVLANKLIVVVVANTPDDTSTPAEVTSLYPLANMKLNPSEPQP